MPRCRRLTPNVMTTALLRSLLSCALLAAAAPTFANDFPTADRVIYVQECMRNNPGPNYEMVSKCSCALDAIATELKFEEYTTMATISNGMTIGGERGGAIRDTPTLAPQLKRYRELQTKAKTSCFIADPK